MAREVNRGCSRRPKCTWPLAALLVLLGLSGRALGGVQDGATQTGLRQAFDELLDLNVRDGFVYYRALKLERARLDRYLASLAVPQTGSGSRDESIAFWINAYNALVLRTVVDNYPIAQRTGEYPAGSIRQIPGAFERLQHRVAGRTVTLDQIEQAILPAFRDPRVFLALGRASVGGGRLRSETYTAADLEGQLTDVAAECVNRSQCVQIDRDGTRMLISPVFSWRRTEFIEAYADKAVQRFNTRSPIERAILAFVDPKLLIAEHEFLAKNEFKVEYLPFDWSLNDLTGRGGR